MTDRLVTVRYGPDPWQEGDLHLASSRRRRPVVVLIHGGFWRAFWKRDLLGPLAEDLSAAGFAVWNIEYRTVGAGGGWPETLRDVAQAFDLLSLLAHKHPIDVHRIAVMGHSAGGQLAAWLAGRSRFGTPLTLGRAAEISPSLLVGLAPVLDLVSAEERGLGGHATAEFLGGTPAEVPERYSEASVAHRLPLRIPQVLVHGTADDRVPFSLSQQYVDSAIGAGDDVRLIPVVDGDHFDVIDPNSRDWPAVRAATAELLGHP